MKVLLIADSPDFDLALVKRLAESHDRIVVLDGAAAKVRGVINPHLICGDFDSLDVEMAKTWYPGAEFLFLPDQYKNDLEKALLHVLDEGGHEVSIVCAFGGRMDISFANLSVVARYHDRASLSLRYSGLTMRVISDLSAEANTCRFSVPKDSPLSVIAFDRSATVSIENVRYPLSRGILEPGSMGVSNTACGGEVRITAHQGTVFVFYDDV